MVLLHLKVITLEKMTCKELSGYRMDKTTKISCHPFNSKFLCFWNPQCPVQADDILKTLSDWEGGYETCIHTTASQLTNPPSSEPNKETIINKDMEYLIIQFSSPAKAVEAFNFLQSKKHLFSSWSCHMSL
eukprot:UN32792